MPCTSKADGSGARAKVMGSTPGLFGPPKMSIRLCAVRGKKFGSPAETVGGSRYHRVT